LSVKTRPVLTLEDCRIIHAAAEAEARRNDWMVAIAILDDGGHLLHFARMDGATPANAGIALEKGRRPGRVRFSPLSHIHGQQGGRNRIVQRPVQVGPTCRRNIAPEQTADEARVVILSFYSRIHYHDDKTQRGLSVRQR